MAGVPYEHAILARNCLMLFATPLYKLSRPAQDYQILQGSESGVSHPDKVAKAISRTVRAGWHDVTAGVPGRHQSFSSNSNNQLDVAASNSWLLILILELHRLDHDKTGRNSQDHPKQQPHNRPCTPV